MEVEISQLHLTSTLGFMGSYSLCITLFHRSCQLFSFGSIRLLKYMNLPAPSWWNSLLLDNLCFWLAWRTSLFQGNHNEEAIWWAGKERPLSTLSTLWWLKVWSGEGGWVNVGGWAVPIQLSRAHLYVKTHCHRLQGGNNVEVAHLSYLFSPSWTRKAEWQQNLWTGVQEDDG